VFYVRKEEIFDGIDSLTLDDAKLVNNNYEYKSDESLNKINYLFDDELYFFEIEENTPIKILKSEIINFMANGSACLINLPDGIIDDGFNKI